LRTQLNELAEELAVAAWNRVQPEASEPSAIETLKDSGFPMKTAIYRLVEAGPDGTNVVAKRSRLAKAVVERAVYEQLLPTVPTRALTYYGADEEQGSGFCWLFLEAASGEAFERTDHAGLIDEWLAGMHTATAEVARPDTLPAKRPAHYLDLLHTARKGVARALAGDGWPDNEQQVLTAALTQLDVIEGRWGEMVELCGGMPNTLQHGDFVRKNLIVDPAGALVPLDWEAAGWGPPVVDLSFVDAGRYHSLVSTKWPELSVEAIARAATAGRILWHLSAIRWATRDLPAERSRLKLERHQGLLADDLEAAGW
jgi:hypothetical protein